MDSETAAAFELFMAESQQASSSSRTVIQNCHSELTSGHPWSPSSRLSAVLFSAVITQSAAVNAASHQRWLLVFIVQRSLSVLFIAMLSWLSPDIVTLCCIWAWQTVVEIFTTRVCCSMVIVSVLSVAVFVCLFWALTFESVYLETSFLLCVHVFRLFRSSSFIKVIGSRSRSYKHTHARGVCLRLKGILVTAFFEDCQVHLGAFNNISHS